MFYFTAGVTNIFIVYISNVLSGVLVTIDGGLDWMIGFIAPHIYIYIYIHSHSELQATQRYRYSNHLWFIVTHALGFSVFTSRILATDL
jgi:hypothetical protein